MKPIIAGNVALLKGKRWVGPDGLDGRFLYTLRIKIASFGNLPIFRIFRFKIMVSFRLHMAGKTIWLIWARELSISSLGPRGTLVQIRFRFGRSQRAFQLIGSSRQWSSAFS